MEKAELKELLKESTEKALFELGKILDKNGSLYDELIILWKRHDDIEREIRLGTIGFEEASRENNKVTDSLLKVIDKVEKTEKASISHEKYRKEIPIEEAIEWLSNSLKDNEFDYEKFYPSNRHIIVYKIGAVQISADGMFSVNTRTVIHSIKNSKVYEYKYNIEGNFQDIGSTFVEEDNDVSKGCIYELKCRATNYKKVFKRTPLHKISYRTAEDIEEDINHTFGILFEDYESAIKAKNAIDYLAIHFGRKEDAF